MPYGLLSTGYVPKPQTVCRDELSVAIRAKRGPSCDTSDGSFLGQLIGIFSERESLLWDLGQRIVWSQDPDSATGAFHDAVCALTGTFRDAARSSVVVQSMTGVPTTVIAVGTQVKTASTGRVFETIAPATIAVQANWTVSTVYAVGIFVTNASMVYRCITAGTSAASGGPATTSQDITDGGAHWQYIGDGAGLVNVLMASVEKDAVVAVAGDLSVINTPIGGLQTTRNVLDAELGALEQPDESLRVTREAELATAGSTPAESLRAAILKVGGVTSVSIFMNLTDVTDANGIPPHAVQALVQGGDDAAIAEVVRLNIAAGIVSFGTTTVALVDSEGTSHNIKFSRPTALPVYVSLTYTYNPAIVSLGGYPADGDVLAKLAVVAFGDSLGAGRNVTASAMQAAVFPVYANGQLVLGVQGILDVTITRIGLTAAPASSTTLVVTPFQIATFDTSRVVITSSAGSL